MNKYDEAINYWQNFKDEINELYPYASVSGIKRLDEQFPMTEIAIEALQQAKVRENPQPLTLEQLNERIGSNPIWDNVDKNWCIISNIIESEIKLMCKWGVYYIKFQEHRFYDHEPVNEMKEV